MKRKVVVRVEMMIDNCTDCFFWDYDPYQDCKTNSGHKCTLANKKLISNDVFKVNIPKWCPFNKKVGGDYVYKNNT